MSDAQVVAFAASIIGSLASAIAIVWKRGNDSERKISEVYEARLADKDREVERWIGLATELRREAPLDRDVVDKLSATIQQLREAIVTGTRGQP